MSASMVVAVVVSLLLGAALGYLAARRSADGALHALEVQLAALRTQLGARDGQVQQLEQQLARAAQGDERRAAELAQVQSAAARAQAEARLLEEQAAQWRRSTETLDQRLEQAQAELALAAARVAKATADLDASAAIAARAPGLEARVAELSEAVARREADVDAQRTRADQLSVEAAAAAPLRAQVQAVNEALVRLEAEGRAQLDVRAQLEGELRALRPLREQVQAQGAELARATAALDAERLRTGERLAEAERARETLKLEVQALGQQLLEEKGRAMVELSRQGLEGLLAPMRESFKSFQDQFQRSAEETIRDRASFLEQVRGLQDAQGKLSAEANALARALTGDSKAQGDWGEVVLAKLLESAGLQEGVHFDLQLNHVTEEGKHRRPDALVYLPGERAIVIDSKCSLTAFIASTRAVDDGEREQDLGAHRDSLRAHVKELARKDYTSVLKQRSPDFVLMFVPSEAAFQAAIARDPGLVDDAYRASRVVICSPTTVLATLQMVSHVWRTERQTTNAQKIAEEAGKMVDKLSGVVEAFAKVRAQLDLAQASLGEAEGRLSTGKGSLLVLANRVSRLGARVKPEKLLSANRAAGLPLEGDGDAEDQAEAAPDAPGGALLGPGDEATAS